MKEFLEKINFPKEAADEILTAYDTLAGDADIYKKLCDTAYEYFEKGLCCDFRSVLEDIAAGGIFHLYTVHSVFLLVCAKLIKPKYDEKGIPEEIYYDTMSDMSYKTEECIKMYGFAGISSFGWYHGIFTMSTFMLGRLEYAVTDFPYDSYKDYIKKGETMYACHIPSSGPLTEQAVMDSLKKAYRFFGCEKYLVVHCSSWLLYPPLYDIYPEGSNLRKFYDSFDIIGSEEGKDNSVIWRIFYKDALVPVEELPTETRLQKGIVGFIKKGGIIGCGKGILVFDGEKTVNID